MYESNNLSLYNIDVQKEIKKAKANQISSENKFSAKKSKYKYQIENGDIWLEKKHWKNAIFLYKNAVAIYPENFDANYRLSLTYSYNCNFKNLDCEKGMKLNNRLLKYYPNNLDLQELKIIFDKKVKQ